MFGSSDYDDDGCGCVSGPAGTCSSCKRIEESYETPPRNNPRELFKNDEYVFTDFDILCSHEVVRNPTPLYYSEPTKTKKLKVKWIETVTDKAILVLSKKDEWFWIPLSFVEGMEKTKKGNIKLEVFETFKRKVIQVPNHHYFDIKEHK